MLGRSRRIVTTIAVVAVTMLGAAAPSHGFKLGNNLLDVPDAGVCSTTPPQPEATCTETQLILEPGHDAPGGLLSEHHGVITSWQVASGQASSTTAGVQMRLRLLRGGVPIAGATTPYVTLPLGEPGLHSFPARLPLDPDGELGLDLAVLGTGGGPGSAPIAHREAGLGEVGEWAPVLGAGVPRGSRATYTTPSCCSPHASSRTSTATATGIGLRTAAPTTRAATRPASRTGCGPPSGSITNGARTFLPPAGCLLP
jgi:hypothetical protein